MRKLLLLTSFAIAGCGELLRVEAEAEQVCVRQIGEALPGTGAVSPVPVSGSIAKSFPLALGDIADLSDAGLDAQLEVLSFRISAGGGAFAGLERLAVSIAPPVGSGLTPLSLVSFPGSVEGAPIAFDGVAVSVDLTAAKHDLLRYVEAGELAIQLEAEGVLPLEEWRADVEVCVAADAAYEYGR
jgi:hypothetical protein